MFEHLVLHPSTQSQLDSMVSDPVHAVLLTGPIGIGKTAVAEAFIAALLGISHQQLATYPHYRVVRPDGASISIEAIRDLQKFLQLKTTGKRPIRRAVLVEYAHALTTEAQNAYLKVLEEPPADTVLVLTADNPRALLPTILSRTQQVAITPPTEAQLGPMLQASGKEALASQQAYFLSGGLPGLLQALLSENGHPLAASVTTAKEFLQKQPLERLAMVDGLSKQRDTALQMTLALERIAQSGLAGAGTKQDLPRIKQWHRVRSVAAQTRQVLERSGNAKLALTNLCLQI